MKLLTYFGQPGTLRGNGSPKLFVKNRNGRGVAVDLHPGKEFWSASVSRALNHLEITREEFFAWDKDGRKPTPR